MERLKITPAERITIVSLISFSMVWVVAGYVFEPGPLYDSEDYQAIEQVFRKRSKALEEKEARLQARFEGRSVEPAKKKRMDRADQKIDINKADVVALQTLPGIGPVMAERIKSFRNREGPFKRVEDLVLVKGIGRVTLQKLRGSVVLEQE